MPTWAHVTQWKPDAISKVADMLTKDRNALLTLQEHLDDSATPEEWQGAAARAAQAQLRRYREQLEDLVAGLSAVISRVDGTADIAHSNADAIEAAEEIARIHQFLITDAGAIVDTGVVLETTPQDVLDTRSAVEAELRERVAQVLERADDIDHDLAALMNQVIGGRINDEGATSLAGAAFAGTVQGFTDVPEVPKNGTPTQNAAWWATLTAGEKQWLIRNRADLIGNLNGLPTAARSEANVARLAVQRQLIETLLRHKRALRDDLWPWEVVENHRLDADIANLEAKLAALDNINSIMYRKGELREDRSLITLDLDGERARAAIGEGDVDTADNLAVFTPGMNSTVEGNLDDYVRDMKELKGYSEELLRKNGVDESVAAVTWLDYEPPRADPSEGIEGTTRDRAEVGAHRLASFLDGIEASRSDDVRITTVSHSYGSLTTGLALRETSASDATVFTGSPGTGSANPDGRGHVTPDIGTGDLPPGEKVATDSPTMRVPDGSSYNLSIPDDFVSNSGWHGVNPSLDANITELDSQPTHTPDGQRLHNIGGHSGYTVADGQMSASEYNTAAIIADLPELAIQK
ncbi:MAG: alpha/beta hydrolase [Haloechinothrix sp.]